MASDKKGKLSKKPHSFSARKLHDGSYHMEKVHPNGEDTEGSAQDMDELMSNMKDHFGGDDADDQPAAEALPGQAPTGQ